MNERRDLFAALLALLLTLAFFALVAGLFLLPIPETNKDMLNTAAGILFGGATGAWGYYFGSSQGSRLKDDAIANLTTKE